MKWAVARQTVELDPALARMVAPWLEDEFVERYVRWSNAAKCVQDAYEDWRASLGPDRAIAFAAYQAALDREQHAAAVLRDSAERISGAQE
jgi:hypothetical protein